MRKLFISKESKGQKLQGVGIRMEKARRISKVTLGSKAEAWTNNTNNQMGWMGEKKQE